LSASARKNETRRVQLSEPVGYTKRTTLGTTACTYAAGGQYDTIHTLERNFDVYPSRHHTPGLPADNNVPNIIKQLHV
jgi:hypothetical protein